MPQGSATTARHQGALSAHYRFVPLGARYMPASSYRRPEAGRWKLAATDLEYEVTRVKSPVLGRDLNPMGRGDGIYYANGGNAALSSSVAVRSAKPRLTGESAIGFGSSVNNQCCGAGAGSAGGASPPGEFPRIPIHPINNDPATHWRLKSGWPDALHEKLIYWAEIENRCVNSSTGVIYRQNGTYYYCQNTCTLQAAMRFASRLYSLCIDPVDGKNECFVYVADLPETKWDALYNEKVWGVVIVWGCPRSEEKRSPLLKSMCKHTDWGGISIGEANATLTELFGGPVTSCSWSGGGGSGGTPPPPGGGGGGDDEGIIDRVEQCIEEAASRAGLPIDLFKSVNFRMCVDRGIRDILETGGFANWIELVMALKDVIRECARQWLSEKITDEQLEAFMRYFEECMMRGR